MESNGSIRIPIQYTPTDSFHTIYCSGVHGGITPAGKLTMNFYTERSAFPQQATLEIDPKANHVREVETVNANLGLIREVQFGAIMDIEMAINLRDWLDKRIQQFQQGAIKK